MESADCPTCWQRSRDGEDTPPASTEKRRAYLIHSGGGGSSYGDGWEFHGVFPERQPAFIDRLSRLGRAWTEERLVTRDELERIKEDDITDDEWSEYEDLPQPARVR
jgi:hypothetical protein